jgi:hypothetical protein
MMDFLWAVPVFIYVIPRVKASDIARMSRGVKCLKYSLVQH